ncbi:MAG: hypothetical protein IJQ14_05115 [Bacteroidales bacterium]|nr:hypothetical protein [Bacteroidales bacterium]
MKRNILIAVLLTALTAATVSCLRDEPMPVPDPTTTVSYLVDGQEYILMMSGPNSFDNLLDSLFNLAEQGSTVILNNRMYATGNGSPSEPEVYVTPNRDSAYAWCKERYEAGLTVYISYDETTRNYNCIAMATYHPDQHLLYVSIDRGDPQMLILDSDTAYAEYIGSLLDMTREGHKIRLWNKQSWTRCDNVLLTTNDRSRAVQWTLQILADSLRPSLSYDDYFGEYYCNNYEAFAGTGVETHPISEQWISVKHHPLNILYNEVPWDEVVILNFHADENAFSSWSWKTHFPQEIATHSTGGGIRGTGVPYFETRWYSYIMNNDTMRYYWYLDTPEPPYYRDIIFLEHTDSTANIKIRSGSLDLPPEYGPIDIDTNYPGLFYTFHIARY